MENKRIIKIMKYANRVHTDIHPPSLQVSLTDKCFNKCGFCDHWKRDNHKSIKVVDWLKYLHNAVNNGLESVCYLGGDAMAYKDLNSIMSAHISNGSSFGFITTGYVPTTVDMNLLNKARWIRCSLDAVSNDVYSKVRGGVKLSKVKSSISRMIDNKCNVEIYATMHNENWNDVWNILQYALELKINLALTPAEDGTCENDMVNFSEFGFNHYKNAFDEAKLSLSFDKHTGNPKKYTFNKCNAVYYQLYIEASGDIYPCCHIAGDTKLHPYSNPIANISDDWYEIAIKRYKFAELNKNQRPIRCNICGERFQTINHLIENISPTRNEFF